MENDETAEIGDNSGVTRVAQEELQNFARRLMKLEDDKKEAVAEHNEAIKDVKTEAASRGYDVKRLNDCMRLLRLDADDRAVLHVYIGALNVFD